MIMELSSWIIEVSVLIELLNRHAANTQWKTVIDFTS